MGPFDDLRRRLRSRRVIVRDASMAPSLRAGDRLWLDPRAYARRGPAVGDVVVLVDPEDRRRWIIKRVAATSGMAVPGRVTPGDPLEVPNGAVFVLSDARDVGRDSRRFGTVPLELLRGRAWYRYGPKGRVGPLDASDPPTRGSPRS